jgi:pyruvate/2-oxoglutarate dehydrogenase complex dihydrolipoamide acyltransferase (E2) component
MREQINNNPMVQIGLVVLLLLVAGFLLMSSMGGGEEGESAPAETGTATIETPTASASLTVTAPTTTEATAAPTSVAGVSPVPRPRLPQAVRKAIDDGHTTVLLVVKRGGIDDARVNDAVDALSSRPQVATFVIPVDQTPRYTAITQPVELDRAPALIVVRPRRLAHGLPSASINYGFQSIATVVQAVVDAEYRGRELAYHP